MAWTNRILCGAVIALSGVVVYQTINPPTRTIESATIYMTKGYASKEELNAAVLAANEICAEVPSFTRDARLREFLNANPTLEVVCRDQPHGIAL